MRELQTIKQLPEEKAMLEVLQEIRFEQCAREICEMSTAIAHRYQSASKFCEVASEEQGIGEDNQGKAKFSL